MGSTNINNENQDSFLGRVWSLLFTKVTGIVAMLGKIARDEPRRVTHSLKVGLAITLVSLLYYFQPSYKSFGSSAMWAIMTVVVVNEFTVGATLGKGLNRVMATLVAGGLGVGAHHLASLCGNLGRHFVIGFFVFLLASVTTFMRFSPKIKARYDYGFSIFILTFCFISISGYRAEEIIEVAHKRLSTIAIGVSLSLLINILIFPVWAGEKLHNSISLNMENLGHLLQEFGTAEVEANSKDESKSFSQGYKNVLNSKSLEESLANFARWEPRHGKFRYRHPWNEYLKLGAQIRQCAHRIDALSAHFNLDILASKEPPREIGEECIKMSLGSGKALKELGSSFKKMNQPCSSIIAHIVSSKAAIKALKSLLKRGSIWKDCDLVGVIPIANIVSLLVDVVDCVDKIATTAYDIANLANFKRFEGSNLPPKKPRFDSQLLEVVNKDSDCSEIVIIAVAELE